MILLLMLDIDGVLHDGNVTLKRIKPPSVRWLKDHERRFLTHTGYLVRGQNLFEHADRLAAALEPFPEVRIVITSTWREHFDLDALKGFLPPTLAERVIGVTPQKFSRDGSVQRLREINAFLQDNDLADEPWIALDDHAYLFGDAPNLLLLDGKEGFTDGAAKVLNQRLRKMHEKL